MTIGELSGSAGASSAVQVQLFKGAQKQEEKVVSKILEGAAQSAPSELTGKGGRINTVA
jgi:hypothetical protein